MEISPLEFEKILIVDDEPIGEKRKENTLYGYFMGMKYPKEMVDIVGKTAHALELLSISPCDILITRINRQDIDGINVSHTAKEKNSDTRIFFTTGDLRENAMKVLEDSRAPEYENIISGPISLGDFIELLNKHV